MCSNFHPFLSLSLSRSLKFILNYNEDTVNIDTGTQLLYEKEWKGKKVFLLVAFLTFFMPIKNLITFHFTSRSLSYFFPSEMASFALFAHTLYLVYEIFIHFWTLLLGWDGFGDLVWFNSTRFCTYCPSSGCSLSMKWNKLTLNNQINWLDRWVTIE